MEVNIDAIKVVQPLRGDLGDIEGLAESFARCGILEPLVIDADYNLIAGHRRLAAAKLAGFKTVPVRILDKPITDQERIELQLIENSFRQDFAPLERAKAYKELVVKYGLSASEVGKLSGYSADMVRQYLRFLTDLSPEAMEALASGELFPSNAMLLCRLDFETQRRILPQACALTHIELRKLVQRIITREELAKERLQRREAQKGTETKQPASQPPKPVVEGDLYDHLLARGEPTLAVLLFDSLVTVVQAQREVVAAQRRAWADLDSQVEMSKDLKMRLSEVAEESLRLAREILQRSEELAELVAAKRAA